MKSYKQFINEATKKTINLDDIKDKDLNKKLGIS